MERPGCCRPPSPSVRHLQGPLSEVGDRPCTFPCEPLPGDGSPPCRGGAEHSELLEQLGRAEYERTRFWGLTPWPQFALTEFVVHAQDIRRPLGVNDSPDVQHLTTAADVFAGRFRRSPLSRVFQPRLPEVRYEATDADWSHGSGPVTRGPLEAIVMVLAGRPVALDDLSGDGVEMLRRRVG